MRGPDAQLIDDVLHAAGLLRFGDRAGAAGFARDRALEGHDAVLHVDIDVAAAQHILVDEVRVNLRHEPTVLDGGSLRHGRDGQRNRESENREGEHAR